MPIFRRFGRPGLLGAVAQTAIIAGTATMIARVITNGMTRSDDSPSPGAGLTIEGEEVTQKG